MNIIEFLFVDGLDNSLKAERLQFLSSTKLVSLLGQKIIMNFLPLERSTRSMPRRLSGGFNVTAHHLGFNVATHP